VVAILLLMIRIAIPIFRGASAPVFFLSFIINVCALISVVSAIRSVFGVHKLVSNAPRSAGSRPTDVVQAQVHVQHKIAAVAVALVGMIVAVWIAIGGFGWLVSAWPHEYSKMAAGIVSGIALFAILPAGLVVISWQLASKLWKGWFVNAEYEWRMDFGGAAGERARYWSLNTASAP
jgi:hypothetical protein